MTRDEAKELLQLCRPGNEDDRNAPELAEAFAMLDADSGLREWFEAQQAFDARFADALAGIEAPAELKDRLLARESGSPEPGAKAPPIGGRENPGSTAPSWWRKARPALAAAAVAVLAFVAARTWQTPDVGPASASPAPAVAGVPDVVRFLSEQIEALPRRGLDKMDHRLHELTVFLAQKEAPTPALIPVAMKDAPPIGCAAFDYGDAKISMICFRNGTVYHLSVVRKGDIPDHETLHPGDFQVGAYAFRLWEEGDQVHILTTQGNIDDLPENILNHETTA